MPLTISETLLDGNGSAISGAYIYCDASVSPLLVNQGSGMWEIADQGHYAVATTNNSGVWSLTLPWPDHCDPASVGFTLTLPDGSQWQGKVPQGVAGPLSIEQLKTSYGWTTPKGSSTSLQIVQTPPAASPYILASAYGQLGTADDTATIQSAINAAAAAGGGTVLLPPGTFTVSQLVLGNRVWLRGCGMHATKLLQKANTSGDFITNHVSSGSSSDPDALFCAVLDLMLDGNKANQTTANNAINFSSYNSTTFNVYSSPPGPDDDNDTHQLVQNVFIVNFKGSGCVSSIRGEMRYINVHVLLCDQYGFYPTYDSVLLACTCGQSGLQGFYLAANANIRVSACKAFLSGRLNTALGHGFHIVSNVNGAIALSSCEAQDNQAAGFLIDTTSRVSLAACIADSNNVSQAGYPAFDLWAAKYCRLDGCVALDRSPAGTQHQIYGLRVRNGSSANSVIMTHSYTQGGTQPTVVVDPASSVAGNDLRIGSMGGIDIATVAAAGTYTPDPYNKGDTALITMSGTITIANPSTGHPSGTKLTLVLIDTAAHAITWGTQFVGSKPGASVNGRTIVTAIYDTTNWQIIGNTTT